MSSIECRTAIRRARGYAFAFLLVTLALPANVVGQTVTIGPGSSWSLGNAAVDLDCAALDVAGALDAQNASVAGVGNLAISGQLSAASASIEVGGNWTNHGSFVAGMGTVRLVDRCDRDAVSINGSTTFSTLLVQSARNKAYFFEAGQTQSILTALGLSGAPGALLPLRSTLAAAQSALALNPAGSQQIAWVDVADMAAPEGSAWLAEGPPSAFNSVDSGNNARWFEPAPAPPAVHVPIPAASDWVLLALALVLGAVGMRGVRLR
jgi:hypothetical protein